MSVLNILGMVGYYVYDSLNIMKRLECNNERNREGKEKGGLDISEE